MAARAMNRVVQHLRNTALGRAGTEPTDGQLLECFVSRRDATALAALVERHAPMVWGVCRRILHGYHDAEDAFQATFLVLVRRAAAVVPRDMVANWLYGVARQTALKARASAAKRRGRERQAQTMPEPGAPQHDGLWTELQPILDEELSRLPDKYRAAIVLCALEGKTRKEASRQLGCPEGTLAARLARGRALLARRLAQRGLAVSSGALAAGFAQQAASAAAPAAVVSATIRTATALAAGQAAASAASAKVVALTEGVLKAMFLNKLARGMTVVLMLGMVGAAGGLAMHVTAANSPTAKLASAELHPTMPVMHDDPPAASAKDTVAIRAKVPGEIVNMSDELHVGKTVRKGDVLVVLSSKPLALKVLDFIDALKQQRVHQDRLARLKPLHDQGAIPLATYRTAEQDAGAGAAALERARRILKIWGLTDAEIAALSADAGKTDDLGRFAIRAPLDGTIVERLCQQGDLVDERTVLARLQPAGNKQPAGKGAEDAVKLIKIGANLDAVDVENAMVTLTVARRIVGKEKSTIVNSQLVNIWLAKDAKILIGDKAAKLSDLRPKCGVWVRLGELEDGFRIVEIQVMQAKKAQ